MYLVILLFALFASLFTLSKSTLAFTEPFFMIGARMTFAGLLLLGHQLLFNRRSIAIKAEHIKPLFLLGFLNIYVTNIAEIWGIKHMISSKACLIYSLSPFMAAFIAYIVLKEVLSPRKWLGMSVGFIGLIPILYTQTTLESTSGQFGIVSMAELSILVAVLSSVYGWILLKKLISEYNYSPILANGISMTLGGTLALMHSYLSGESWAPIPVTNLKPFLQNTFLMCLISNIVCYNLYGFLLKRFTATFMSFAGLVTPLFASFFGWVFLQEHISWHFFASMTLFSIGLSIFYQEELKKDKGIHVSKPLVPAKEGGN